MALVTPPTFIDGFAPTGEEVFDAIYTLSSDVLNGRVDENNLALLGDRSVTHPYLQSRSASGGGMTAGTCSLDYFVPRLYTVGSDKTVVSGIYRGDPSEESAERNEFIAIPGASIQFYLPFKAYVLLTWQITWTNDSEDKDDESHIRLFIDGEKGANADCNVRRVRRTMFPADSTGVIPNTSLYLRDRYKGRYWSGHKWVGAPLSKGFHSASLRVIQNKSVRQTRVRARSMKYIFFRAGND